MNVDDRGTYSCAVTYPASDGFTGGVMKIKPFTVFVSGKTCLGSGIIWIKKLVDSFNEKDVYLFCYFVS